MASRLERRVEEIRISKIYLKGVNAMNWDLLILAVKVLSAGINIIRTIMLIAKKIKTKRRPDSKKIHEKI